MSYLTQIIFGKVRREDENFEKAYDLVSEYLCRLMNNGQITDDSFSYAAIKGIVHGYVNIPRSDAMILKHHTKWAKESLKKIKDYFKHEPQWHILEDDIPKRFLSWKSAKELYLFTHAFSENNYAVWSRVQERSIPIYLLPLSDEEKEDIFRWSSTYVDYDNIWIHSGNLEMPAYKEIADVHSDLNKNGRELCKIIEKKTGIPTFYYLIRYYGRKENHDNRVCPGCGKPWHTKYLKLEDTPFHQFHFCCKKCRLVSHRCDDFNKRYAKISEYRGTEHEI